MGKKIKNRTLVGMVEHQLILDNAPCPASNVEKGNAFARVCAKVLFTDIEAREVTHCDGASDHGIDFYRIYEDGSIAIAQCKYDDNHDPRRVVSEICKPRDFILSICAAYDADEDFNPDAVFKKMHASLKTFVNAVVRLYATEGINGVKNRISYYFFMAASASTDCEIAAIDAKNASGFNNIVIYAGEDIVELRDAHIVELNGVPELDLGIKQAEVAAAHIAFAKASRLRAHVNAGESDNNMSEDVHDIFAVSVLGCDLVKAICQEFKSDHNFNRLFSSNVRCFLKNKELGEQIAETISNDPNSFIDYNNGLTVVCTGITHRKSFDGTCDDDIILENAAIVNGLQTTTNIYNAFKDGIDVSNIAVSCQIIVEPDQNKRKQVSVHRNIQKPITAVDIRATDERPMLLKSHMEDVGFCLGVKRGDELPKGISKYDKCGDFKKYIQYMAAFAVHQPHIARNCGSPLLLDDRWFQYLLAGDYTHDNSPAAYGAAVMRLANHLQEVISEFGNKSSGKDTTGLIYSALNVLGIQAEMLYKAAGAKNTTFDQLGYEQPAVQRKKDAVDLSKPFVQYDMAINHIPAESVNEMLCPFIEWLYEDVKTKSAAAGIPLNNGLRNPMIFQAVAADLCVELSNCNFSTCEQKFECLKLIKPYEG